MIDIFIYRQRHILCKQLNIYIFKDVETKAQYYIEIYIII